MAGGLERGAIDGIKSNRSLRKARRSSYSKVREQYIGVGNESNLSRLSHLTPTQIAEGRARAKAYYKKRNRRIYTQITVIAILSLTLVIWLANK